MWFSTVFPIHMSTVDCQVPSINNNWNNPDLWISVFCAQCYWPVVKILLSLDSLADVRNIILKKIWHFLSNFTREKILLSKSRIGFYMVYISVMFEGNFWCSMAKLKVWKYMYQQIHSIYSFSTSGIDSYDIFIVRIIMLS